MMKGTTHWTALPALAVASSCVFAQQDVAVGSRVIDHPLGK
jgi:hypothetical protein